MVLRRREVRGHAHAVHDEGQERIAHAVGVISGVLGIVVDHLAEDEQLVAVGGRDDGEVHEGARDERAVGRAHEVALVRLAPLLEHGAQIDDVQRADGRDAGVFGRVDVPDERGARIRTHLVRRRQLPPLAVHHEREAEIGQRVDEGRHVLVPTRGIVLFARRARRGGEARRLEHGHLILHHGFGEPARRGQEAVGGMLLHDAERLIAGHRGNHREEQDASQQHERELPIDLHGAP